MKKPREISEKQKTFCRLHHANPKKTEAWAYRKAGYTGKGAEVSACKLLKIPKIMEYMDSLREKTQKKYEVTVDSIMAELNDAKQFAYDCESPAAVNQAIMGKAKVAGLLIEKKEVTGGDGEPLSISVVFKQSV